MAVVAITGSPSALGQLVGAEDSFPLAIARTTARDNGDGTWTVAASTAEANIPALTDLGCTVRVVVTDADELARWQVIDTQISTGPPVA